MQRPPVSNTIPFPTQAIASVEFGTTWLKIAIAGGDVAALPTP